jgi:ABC-type tungstate transport system permease subunit
MNGDADAVRNARPRRCFVEALYGINRLDVRYNDFILSARLKHPPLFRPGDRQRALTDAAAGDLVLRGDDRARTLRELSLWSSAGSRP